MDYKDVPLLTGDESRAAEVHDADFPKLLDPVDDEPPATVVTRISRTSDGKWKVRGVAEDDGAIKTVIVNGRAATATAPNFAEWEAVLDGTTNQITAHAEDAAGNVETYAQVVTLPRGP